MRYVSAVLAAVVAVAVVAVGAGASPTPSDTATASDDTVAVRPAVAGDLDAAAAALVADMSMRERAASVVMGHIPTTDAGRLRAYMTHTGVGGFILMGANVPSDERSLRDVTTALGATATLPPLIAVDEEGGQVTRLPWDHLPGAERLRDASPEAVRTTSQARGALVHRAGIGADFGIIADVTDDPTSFIYRRVLGTTPRAAGERVAAAVAGQREQVLTTLKHFPGHGAVSADSHTSVPVTSMPKKQWARTDALPFRQSIDAGAQILMFGHLVYRRVDDAPASLSARWHRIARDDLGFDGLMITDDLGMLQASGDAEYRDPVANAVRALVSGNDMVLAVMSTTPSSATHITDGIVAAVDDGTLSQERLTDAAEHVMRARLQVAAASPGLRPCDRCDPVR